MLMTEIAAGWTAATNLLVRIVERSIHTVCLLMVGALIGAWIVQLTEVSEIQDQLKTERGNLRVALDIADKWRDEHRQAVRERWKEIHGTEPPPWEKILPGVPTIEQLRKQLGN